MLKTFKFIPIPFLFWFAFGCQNTNSNSDNEPKKSVYEMELTIKRIENSEKMKNPETTIIGKDLQDKFDGLKYYPVDESWKMMGSYQKIDSSDIFEMTTTTERVIPMKKAGKITFWVEGNSHELFAYRNMDHPDEDLFVPFLDLTNGDETYGGGRYLDIPSPDSDSILIDFNLAYNPYCAYNHDYSCPVPPLENTLHIAVSAGEKTPFVY
jgi:uncharacterized protein (DUF1684 family)